MSELNKGFQLIESGDQKFGEQAFNPQKQVK